MSVKNEEFSKETPEEELFEADFLEKNSLKEVKSSPNL